MHDTARLVMKKSGTERAAAKLFAQVESFQFHLQDATPDADVSNAPQCGPLFLFCFFSDARCSC